MQEQLKECKFVPDVSKTQGRKSESRTLKEFLSEQSKYEKQKKEKLEAAKEEQLEKN